MGAPDLYAIRQAHGGAVYDGGRRWVGPGPGHSRKDASLSVWINDDNRALIHSFAGDPFNACSAYLGIEREATPASPNELAAIRRRREAERRRADAETRAFCRKVWAGVGPIEGTPAEGYLWSRGLIYEGAEIGFHPSAPRTRQPNGASHPAMVALVRNAAGCSTGLHLTYVTPDGRKAFGDRSRLMFGPVAGGAVRLDQIGRSGVLAIGEGIETSFAFGQLMGVPAWASLSTSGMQVFAPAAGVKRLLIAADSDDSGAGLKAAHALAERVQRVCDVEIHPAPDGRDWADMVGAHG